MLRVASVLRSTEIHPDEFRFATSPCSNVLRIAVCGDSECGDVGDFADCGFALAGLSLKPLGVRGHREACREDWRTACARVTPRGVMEPGMVLPVFQHQNSNVPAGAHKLFWILFGGHPLKLQRCRED